MSIDMNRMIPAEEINEALRVARGMGVTNVVIWSTMNDNDELQPARAVYGNGFDDMGTIYWEKSGNRRHVEVLWYKQCEMYGEYRLFRH